MIIMMVILLLTTLVSIALSMTTFNRLASEQSKVLSQLKNEIRSALVSQFDIIQINLSQKVMELVTGQSNISQNLNQLDTKLETSGPLLIQYLQLHVQMQCGPGLWYRLVYIK